MRRCFFAVAGVCFLMAAGVHATSTNCPPELQLNVVATAGCALPEAFVTNVTENVQKRLAEFQIDRASITNAFNNRLNAWVQTNSAADSSWTDRYEQKKDSLLKELQTALDEADQELAATVGEIRGAVSSRVAAEFEADPSAIHVDAQYGYCRGAFNPGSPGWSVLGDAFVTGVTRICYSTELDYRFNKAVTLGMSPESADGDFLFDVAAKLKGTVSFEARIEPRDPSDITPAGKPAAETTVGTSLKLVCTNSFSERVAVSGWENCPGDEESMDLGEVVITVTAVDPEKAVSPAD